MTVTLCLSYSLGLLNRRPRAHSAGWFATSYQQLLRSPGSIGVPEGPLSRVWLSLPHLPLQLSETLLATTVARRTQLNYIIVRRPLDLWNWMLNLHRAETTVMQFRGHSLPVRQSIRVSWDIFTSFHFISQFPPTRFSLITAIRMYYFFRCITLNGIFGRVKRSKHNMYISPEKNLFYSKGW